jgi:hypothetical protein
MFMRTGRLETFLKIFLPLIQLAKLLRLQDGTGGGGISGNNGTFLYLIPSYIMRTKSFFGGRGRGEVAKTCKSSWRDA